MKIRRCCATCYWRGQCSEDNPCEYYDCLYDVEEYFFDLGKFTKEYIKYCSDRQNMSDEVIDVNAVV